MLTEPRPSFTAAGWRILACTLLAALLGACGFQLRGAVSLPFETIYLAFPPISNLGTQLRLNISASEGTRVVSNRSEAQYALEGLSETRDRRVLALNTKGRARELELLYSFTFHLVRVADNREAVPATTIRLKRDVSYNEAAELSGAIQEETLYRSMQGDAVQQILRRLGAMTPEQLQSGPPGEVVTPSLPVVPLAAPR